MFKKSTEFISPYSYVVELEIDKIQLNMNDHVFKCIALFDDDAEKKELQTPPLFIFSKLFNHNFMK